MANYKIGDLVHVKRSNAKGTIMAVNPQSYEVGFKNRQGFYYDTGEFIETDLRSANRSYERPKTDRDKRPVSNRTGRIRR